MSLQPILFCLFNRPDVTQQVFTALTARPTTLLVFERSVWIMTDPNGRQAVWTRSIGRVIFAPTLPSPIWVASSEWQPESLGPLLNMSD
jgi:hypothetical protein